MPEFSADGQLTQVLPSLPQTSLPARQEWTNNAEPERVLKVTPVHALLMLQARPHSSDWLGQTGEAHLSTPRACSAREPMGEIPGLLLAASSD